MGFRWVPALAVCLLATVAHAAERNEDWFLVEFSSGRPACTEAVDSETRCWGTRSDIARFEMRADERLELPGSGHIPPAWTTFNGIWVYGSGAASTTMRRSISLTPTPLGVRLIISDEGTDYLQSIPLNEWMELDHRTGRKLWARVSTTAADTNDR